MAYPFQSHVIQFADLGKGLIDRGHEVHMVMSPSLPTIDQFKQKPINLILYEVDEPDFYSASEEEMGDFFESLLDATTLEDLRTSIEGFKQLCSNPLKDKKLFEKLKGMKFDIAIVDAFTCGQCFLVLMHRLGLPYINVVTVQELWLQRNPALPSVTPFVMGNVPYTERMNFWERLDNLWTLIDWHAAPRVEYIDDGFLKQFFYETEPVPLNKLTGMAELWLVDQTSLLDYPRPVMPNEIHIGGITTKPAKPLPDDLEKFMSSNPKGVVVVSFGSMGSNVPLYIFQKLVAAFERVEYNVIMRYKIDKDTKVSPHIKFMSWLPQNDLLGHNNTKLFVTHCGATGQHEALYHGVPMIGFPFFADQHYNAKRLAYRGYGIEMDLRTFKAEDLAANIIEVIENPIYGKTSAAAAATFKDAPMTPREKALYWIEHVIKHGGRHMRSYAMDMVWYEYLMLDILGFVFVVVTSILLTVVCIGKKIMGFLCNSKRKEKVN